MAARRGKVGQALLKALVGTAVERGIWTIQTSIFPENLASLALRERIAELDRAWRDTILLELRL